MSRVLDHSKPTLFHCNEESIAPDEAFDIAYFAADHTAVERCLGGNICRIHSCDEIGSGSSRICVPPADTMQWQG
jgi:hypothetical protein